LSEAWIGLIGALSGVLVTGAFGLVVTVLKHRWDTGSELQQRKYRLGETRAESRRSAYIRFLNAASALGDHVLVQPPGKGGGAKDLQKARERVRELQSSNDSCFSEYSEALLEAQMLAGARVLEELGAFDKWAIEQLVASLLEADAMNIGAFFDAEEKRMPLLSAMRDEQAIDLAA
jgi:hypothetical protein